MKKGEGYGLIHEGQRPKRYKVLAHRRSWELSVGPIPKGKCVLHKCDNPGCVRPGHLFLGTQADNMHDMKAKGRQARGAKLPQTKLSDEAVNAIRALYNAGEPQAVLAKEYGVSQSAISMVVNRKRHG